MRLIELSASEPSFNTVRFNKSGLTLIVARTSSKRSKDNTYNGVGKSLIAKIIHFCLGSSRVVAFEKHLPEWTFILKVELPNGLIADISRSTTNQSVIFINGKRMSISKFTAFMGEICFPRIGNTPFLTFRALVSHFIRQGKEGYITFSRHIKRETDFQQLMSNAYLLGIDPDMVLTKKRVKSDIDKTKQTLKHIQSDDELSRYFGAPDGKVSDDLEHLRAEIESLEKQISTFRFADKFSELSQESISIDSAIKSLLLDKDRLDTNVKHIDLTVAKRSSITERYVEKMYAEARLLFGSRVRASLKQALQFHSELSRLRDARLIRERAAIKGQIESLTGEIADKKAEFDRIGKRLGDGGAFNEYIAVSSQRAELARKIERLEAFANLMKNFSERLDTLQKRFDYESAGAVAHLGEVRDQLLQASSIFSELASSFYPARKSGLVVEMNSGVNQIRYDIDVKIESDASDGINDVKIFCFDLMMLLLRCGHSIDFVFHDSRIFSDMDYRQRAVLFKIAHARTAKAGLQYIASVNEEFLDSMKALYTNDEWQAVISNNVTLNLTDKSPASKLLGVQVDMDYDG